MNKAVGIGIGVVIIIAIIGVAYSLSSFEKNEENVQDIPVDLNESIQIEEEIISEEPVEQGREISVEFSESIGIKTQ